MHKIPSPPQAFYDGFGKNADDRAWDYGRACYALALSRGVPADMVLVPRKLTSDMADAYMRLFTGTERFSAERMWDGLLAVAPAAAGAQGEVEVGASVSEQDGGSHHCIGGGNWSPWDLFRLSTDMKLPVNLPAEKAMELRRDIERTLEKALAQHEAPQPAAADGGVRERARECGACGDGCKDRDACQLAEQSPPVDRADQARTILANQFEKEGVFPKEFHEGIRSGKHLDLGWRTALRAIEAALSSHRQAGDDQFRELAERWRGPFAFDGHDGEDWDRGARETLLNCADDLIALVEKGAGS